MKEVRCVFMFAVLTLWMALPVGAQNAKRGITMSLVNESLASALRKVQQESDYKVSFVIEDVKPYTTTVHLKNASASTAVKQILHGKPFTYSVSGKFITVKKVLQHKTAAEATDNGAAIRPLSGTIIDEDGEPMIGASVVVPGSPFGTVTNTDGNFEFYIPKGCHEVTVSYVGMNDQKVKVAGRDHVKIVMSENKTILGEVVVTGYQTISKERATGAFTKVTADELKDKRLGNLSTVLAGEVAGYNDGMIRGVTTMNASASPLYVIDGFPVEKTKLTGNGTGDITEEIPDLNMDDIESITVLKDAAAASIYGARAANGVIVITTKKSAAKGKTNVSFNASLTWHPYSYYTDYLANSSLVVDLEKEWAAQNPNLAGNGAKVYAQNMLDQKIYTSAGICNILNYYAGNISESEMNAKLTDLAGKGYNYYCLLYTSPSPRD